MMKKNELIEMLLEITKTDNFRNDTLFACKVLTAEINYRYGAIVSNDNLDEIFVNNLYESPLGNGSYMMLNEPEYDSAVFNYRGIYEMYRRLFIDTKSLILSNNNYIWFGSYNNNYVSNIKNMLPFIILDCGKYLAIMNSIIHTLGIRCELVERYLYRRLLNANDLNIVDTDIFVYENKYFSMGKNADGQYVSFNSIRNIDDTIECLYDYHELIKAIERFNHELDGVVYDIRFETHNKLHKQLMKSVKVKKFINSNEFNKRYKEVPHEVKDEQIRQAREKFGSYGSGCVRTTMKDIMEAYMESKSCYF